MSKPMPKVFLWLLIFMLCLTGGVSSVLAEDGSSNLTIQGSSSVPETTQSTYTAYYRGTKVSAAWSLSSTDYASIGSTSGVLTAKSVSSNRTVTVRATYRRNDNTYRAYKTVTITNTGTTVSLSGLTVSGPSSVNSGGSANYTATATFSNGTTQNVTTSASWSRSPAVGTISGGSYSPGTVTSNQTVTISASYTSGGVTRSANTTVTVVASAPTVSLSSVAVTGPASVISGALATFTATATFSNGTTQNVTTSATWSRSPAVGTMSGSTFSPGTVTTNQTVTISASYTSGGVTRSASTTIAVVASTATLSSVSVTGPASVNSGASVTYTATATFSNGTTQNVTTSATWSRSPAVGTMSGSTFSPGTVTTNQTVTISASYTSGGVTRSGSTTVNVVASTATVTLSSVAVTGPASVNSGTSAVYAATATFSNGTTQNVTASATWSRNPAIGTISGGNFSPGTVTSNQTVTISAAYTSNGVTRNGAMAVAVVAGTTTGGKSINSTSQNRATQPTAAVAEQALTNLSGFSIFSVNDLGMHCGDLDHRVASILPPFNTLHAQVIQKGTSTAPPRILTSTEVDVVYSASSNPADPALKNPTATPIFKTNFWDPSPLQPTTSIAFDCYDPFYPPGILGSFAVLKDMGLPSPDNAKLYPVTGASQLTADQQNMPGITAPYSVNVPQAFKRFDTDFPFFATFPFGYRLTNMKWFSADGIPAAPFDDFGRANSYPLMRVQAKSKTATLGGTVGAVLASVDTVTPVSAEATCTKCHTSSVDGGGGYAADLAFGGSPRSGTKFTVAQASNDTSTNPAAVKKEWAADTNIVRLHDAKHGTTLQSAAPVSCQVCHYTPALDLAHLGPLGPGDANANGRNQKVHRTNSRIMHSYHGQFTDLFPNDMVAPNNTLRIDAATGKPTINTYVTNKLNQTCYQCHPGANTKCLRGAMYNAGLICNDCHGGMNQVGNDFSANFTAATPFPAGADMTKRIPWAHEPKCQSCHTGDAMSNLTASANVIKASDNIRLLQAWRTNDTNATPITATNKRFAEETSSNGNPVLYRLSKGHSGINCEACHGSTHAEYPVLPESGTSIANDNLAATQLQGHTGKIIECTACHTAGSLPVSLGGPHSMHPVGDSRFISNHSSIVSANRAQCQACHGQNGQGTVLSKVAVNRTVGSRTFTKGEQITCSRCHSNELP